MGAELSSNDSFRAVWPEFSSATNKRIKDLCLGLLLSPHLAPDPGCYTDAREALRGFRGFREATTRTILGNQRLIQAALLVQAVKGIVKRVLLPARDAG
jgi:hypothetical protein